MYKNINFVSAQTQQKIKLGKMFRSVTAFLAVILVISLIAYCCTLLLTVSLKIKTKDVDNQITNFKTEIDKSRELESMLQTTKSRSSIIASLVNSKKNRISRYLDMIIVLLDKGYRLKSSLEVKEAVSKIEIEGTVPQAPSLLDVATLMEELKTKEYIASYDVDSISRRDDGSYQVRTVVLISRCEFFITSS